MTIMEIMTEMEKIGAIEKAEYKVGGVMGGAVYSVKGKVVELYYE